MILQTAQLFQRPTILLVEDDLQLAEVFSKALDLKGYDAKLIYNGNLAYQYALDHKIDLILLDIMLPGKDGFQILQELKTSPDTRQIPVIMLSSLSEAEQMEKGMHLGAADYIIKQNIDFHKINKVLEKHLISRDARKNMRME